jgi:hypothetical protein
MLSGDQAARAIHPEDERMRVCAFPRIEIEERPVSPPCLNASSQSAPTGTLSIE